MAKRRRLAESSSDQGESDGSYEPSKPRPLSSTKKRKTSRRARKSQTRVSNDSSAHEDDDAVDADSTVISDQARPHTVSMHVIENPRPLQEALLQWYAGVHESRGMPWRKPYNPGFSPAERAQRAYEVWVSEIMLQQTQVATVIPYYNKWMAKFPTIKDLAASDIETVNSLWKGLGYYSRAARLLSGAQKVTRDYDGCLPDNAKDMEAKIPGIGRYSAGAISSIAYNQCVPVLDGNVHRLLSRVLALYAQPKAKSTLDILWAGAAAMIEGTERPGDLNQALIELGSTVCKVRDPSCESCPLKTWCKAYQQQERDAQPVSNSVVGRDEIPDIEELCALCEPLSTPRRVTVYPMKAQRKKAREELDIVNVVEWVSPHTAERWFLLVRRPEGGLLAGLHEFPTSPDVPVSISASAIADIPHVLLSRLLVSPPLPHIRTPQALKGHAKEITITPQSEILRITKIKPAGEVIHIFSHIRKTYRIQWVVLEGGGHEPPQLIGPTCLRPIGDSIDRGNAAGKTSKAKAKATANKDLSAASEAAWVLMADVPNANIGTGVLKVWKQVSKIWDADE